MSDQPSNAQPYHCLNCTSDYDFATQGAICPHKLRSEGGKDRLEAWPARATEPKTLQAAEPRDDHQADYAAALREIAKGPHHQLANDEVAGWAMHIASTALSTPPRPSQPPGVLPDAVLNVAELLHTQDNRITANPIFAVEVKKRIYGIDPEWGGPVVWLHDGEEVTDPDEIKRLENGWENGDDDPDNYTRTSYHEHWEFVTACLTEEGCKAFLRRDGHNHRGEKRIYAHGGYRNHEWEAVRNFLMSLRPVPTKGVGDAG